MSGLGAYLQAAFSARPLGMPVPPNWLFLAAVGLGGLVNPGVWLLGAGVEVAYLFWLATNPRFQKTVDGASLAGTQRARDESRQTTMQDALALLDTKERSRQTALEARCREILNRQNAVGGGSGGTEALGAGLSRLLWVHLRLLATRKPIESLVSSAAAEDGTALARRASELEARLSGAALGEDLRKSLVAQLDLVRQRLAKRGEAADKLAFLDAELARISEQVELLREQALLATDPRSVSERVDAITGSLGGTAEWIGQQQRLFGQLEDTLAEPPPLTAAPPPARPAQETRR